MPTLRKNENPIEAYVALFDERIRRSAEPSWVQSLHRRGIGHFTELGFPTASLEDWRFLNLNALRELPIHPVVPEAASPSVEAEVARCAIAGWEGPRLVFLDGRFSPGLSVPGTAAGDAWWGSLRSAQQQQSARVERHLGQYARIDESGFSALNCAFFEDGLFVYVPEGQTVAAPIHCLFLSSGRREGQTEHPRNLIVAEAGAQVSVLEHYASLGGEPHFTNTLTEIVAGPGAVVEHCKLQQQGESSFHVGTLQAHVGGQGCVRTHSVALGARLARNNLNLVLAGEGADGLLNGLYLVGGRQWVDHHTSVDHAKPNCTSHEFYHGILAGEARGIFNGKIFVRQDAQKTNAKQTNRNLLLSETATINTKPQLEIFADDVKCTHGATVGQLNEEALFYCRSRGLGKFEAQRMLTHAFAAEILQRIPGKALQERLEQLTAGRLAAYIRPEGS